MSAEPGERRRRRELERARELAAQGETEAPTTPAVPQQGPAAPPPPQQGAAAETSPASVVPPQTSPTPALPRATAPGAAEPQAGAPLTAVPQPAGPPAAAQQPAAVPGPTRAADVAGYRPLSRRELRERERRRAADAGESEPGPEVAPRPTADGEPGSHSRRSSGTVPEQRSPATTAAAGPAGAPNGAGATAARPRTPEASAIRPMARWPAVTSPASEPDVTGVGTSSTTTSTDRAGTRDRAGATSSATTDPATTDPATTDPASRLVSTSDPEVTSPGPRAEDLDGDVDPHEPHRYTWKHYVALAVVAFVLGFLIWSLITTASDPGALSAAAAHPTMSPPVAAAPRGVL